MLQISPGTLQIGGGGGNVRLAKHITVSTQYISFNQQ